ncbi:hypothetical protein DVH05_021130 [Phytophthora capsici]|nr:hypothetical protein DVH05_021130 [Phytophthora capsici]
MATRGTTSQREERAQRRAASQERTAADPPEKPSAPAASTAPGAISSTTTATTATSSATTARTATITLTTVDGGTVTLDMDQVRRALGSVTAAPASGGTGQAASSAGGQSSTGGTTGSTSGGRGSTRVSSSAGSSMNAGPGTNANPIALAGSGTTSTIGSATGPRTGAGARSNASSGATPAPSTLTALSNTSQMPTPPVIVHERVKALRLTKFRGTEDSMPVTMWLKTVRQEVRRQAAILGVEWRERQLYHEVAAHLEGEAQRWFATVMESVPPEQETIGTLSDMLRAKYMTHHTTPEVVDLLNPRRQMRGEKLVEYAQILREIGERGDIGEDWLVNAFLKGMSSSEGATHVRGHRPQTLDEAVNLAVPHVGEYGEGYGVGLETAMGRWDEREAAQGRGPLVAPAAAGGNGQSGPADNFGSVVSGYGAAWGSAEKAPRYDTSGRPVTDGKSGSTEWWRAIPPGFQLTAQNSQPASNTAKSQPTAGSKRPASSDQAPRTKAKTLRVEGQQAASTCGPRGDESAFATREGRMQRNQQRLQHMAPRTAFVPRSGTRCFYCNQEGHFARDCKIKTADLAETSGHDTASAGPQQATRTNDGTQQGNVQRA